MPFREKYGVTIWAGMPLSMPCRASSDSASICSVATVVGMSSRRQPVAASRAAAKASMYLLVFMAV